MRIEINVDKENGIDPVELLGDIKITDGKNVIKQNCTYLDAWLYILVEGFFLLKMGKSAAIQVINEPGSIEFRWTNGIINISYEKNHLFINDLDELESELKKAIKLLIQGISIHKNYLKVEEIRLLKDFLEDKLNASIVSNNPFIKEF